MISYKWKGSSRKMTKEDAMIRSTQYKLSTEVKDALKRSENGKATGLDGIPYEFSIAPNYSA
ncbi:hypothetical protein FOMPIDRAFT_1022927 [Fomitopsis schrenkii]|uniref:Uncharacterized protein n=1 Tax=Fomitopsis schrenkii TaxID=2126942 RepID=S8EGJ5_FOMSC|nr:hypothetical protein FOMPIDRAFT_1022927 [Fomitopsis schrenkii]